MMVQVIFMRQTLGCPFGAVKTLDAGQPAPHPTSHEP